MPQADLLEQLDGTARDLAFALLVYGGDLARLKATVLWQASDELVQIWEADGERPLEVSELKAIWCDDANFLDAERAARYRVRATDKGLKWAYG